MRYPNHRIIPTGSFVMHIHSPTHSNDFRQLPRPVGSIAWVKEGCGEYHTPDHTFRLYPGDILFIPLGGTYISHWEPSPCLFVFQFDTPPTPLYYPIQRIEGYAEAEADFSIVAKSSNSYFAEFEHFYRICDYVWDHLIPLQRPVQDRCIAQAVEYIDTHATEAFSIEELAHTVGLSSSYLFARFRARMGVSPIEYKHQRLISMAERLFLESPDITVEAVAEQLGFSSDAYFRRTFKAITGVSPKDFRTRGLRQI